MPSLNRFPRLTRRVCALWLAALAGVTIAGALGLAPATARADVGEFPQEKRHLDGFWANEFVPGYRCPTSHPYLEAKDYAPFGTSLIKGVSINEDGMPWPIGVSITGASTTGGSLNLANGIAASSATNWSFGRHWYQAVLHCTDDARQGWNLQ
jgi:hypothetical protein